MTCKQGSGCCDNCAPMTANAAMTGKAVLRTHDGREILVCPVVAIVEGVLNGALVPNDEFGKFAKAWEGIPVPVSHPTINGVNVSANEPDVIEKVVIGRFHNVTVEANKLKGEMWIDVKKAVSLGFESIVNSLKNGETVEVSTAYFADIDATPGVYNGKQYAGVHRNLRPDHLAILPNEQGACSVEDGCGTFQNKQRGSIMSKARDALKTLAAMVGINLEHQTMTKAQKIELLLNSKRFDAADKGGLELMSDASIDKLLAHKDGEYEDNEDKPEDEMEAKANEDKEPEDMKKNALDADTLTAINWAKSKYQDEKARLVSRLQANKQCAFSANELKTMHVDTLAKLDASLNADYSGQGGPVSNSAHTEEPLLANSIVLAPLEAK